MDFNIEFSREADIEFNTIDCFFGAMGSGSKFHKDFHLQMMRVRTNPMQFQVRYQDVRIVHLKDFRYSIHYRLVNNTVTVLRILSQHQSF